MQKADGVKSQPVTDTAVQPANVTPAGGSTAVKPVGPSGTAAVGRAGTAAGRSAPATSAVRGARGNMANVVFYIE